MLSSQYYSKRMAFILLDNHRWMEKQRSLKAILILCGFNISVNRSSLCQLPSLAVT